MPAVPEYKEGIWDSRKDLVHSKSTLREELVRHVVVKVEGKDDGSGGSSLLSLELDETAGASLTGTL